MHQDARKVIFLPCKVKHGLGINVMVELLTDPISTWQLNCLEALVVNEEDVRSTGNSGVLSRPLTVTLSTTPFGPIETQICFDGLFDAGDRHLVGINQGDR